MRRNIFKVGLPPRTNLMPRHGRRGRRRTSRIRRRQRRGQEGLCVLLVDGNDNDLVPGMWVAHLYRIVNATSSDLHKTFSLQCLNELSPPLCPSFPPYTLFYTNQQPESVDPHFSYRFQDSVVQFHIQTFLCPVLMSFQDTLAFRFYDGEFRFRFDEFRWREGQVEFRNFFPAFQLGKRSFRILSRGRPGVQR